jgi:hypothetical protein
MVDISIGFDWKWVTPQTKTSDDGGVPMFFFVLFYHVKLDVWGIDHIGTNQNDICAYMNTLY